MQNCVVYINSDKGDKSLNGMLLNHLYMLIASICIAFTFFNLKYLLKKLNKHLIFVNFNKTKCFLGDSSYVLSDKIKIVRLYSNILKKTTQ